MIILFVCTGPDPGCPLLFGWLAVGVRVDEFDIAERDVVEEYAAEGADICDDLELLWLIV